MGAPRRLARGQGGRSLSQRLPGGAPYGRISTGHSITSSAVYQILKTRSSQSGVEDFSPHDSDEPSRRGFSAQAPTSTSCERPWATPPSSPPSATTSARTRRSRRRREKSSFDPTKRSSPSSGGPFRKLRKAPEHVRTSSAAFRSRACVRLRPRPFPAGCARAPSRRWPWR